MRKKIKFDQLDIFYRQKGEGEPVLILHGWEKSAKDYVGLQNRLSKNFSVYSLDLPGFGQSSQPLRPWGVQDYAQFIDRFLAKLGLSRINIIGHSFGGRVAVELAVSYTGKVKKLVLTGVPILRRKKMKRLFFLIVSKVGGLILLIPPFFLLKKLFSKNLYFLVGEGDYYRSRGLKRKILKKVINFDQKKSVKEISVPTLILWGEKDRVTPLENAHYLHQAITGSYLRIIKDASHRLPYENPSVASEALVSFLG